MRNGFLEETYFSWSIIPVVGNDGTVAGLYNPAFEKTRRKVAERRMFTLREVGERTATARDIKGFWQQVLAALDTNEQDTPFVLLYSLTDESDGKSCSSKSDKSTGEKECYLEGALGVPEGHPSAPHRVDLLESAEGFVPIFREGMNSDKPILLEVGTQELPAEMMENLEWRGFGDACRSVVVCTIRPTTSDSTLGFLVMGINPRRPYDDDYGLFVQLLSRQLATSLASVVLLEEEIQRGKRAARLAALDRLDLSEQLAARTQEAIDNATKFTRMAHLSPVGLFIADSEGQITFCNESWYEITKVPRDFAGTIRWMEAIKTEDQAIVTKLWDDLVKQMKPGIAEFRFDTIWEDSNGNRGDTWVLCNAYPEKQENGLLKSIFGCITNISSHKWAEGFQKMKLEEAVELKRQQENFIDITSHEMRNPLGAILQCADEISSSLSGLGSHDRPGNSLPAAIGDSIDAAQTIALCALHQKRIVDDILTLSKLDSARLMITPVDVQPLTVARRALKMFEPELQTASIETKFIVDGSFQSLEIDWVKFDPSRCLQVLINLISNALKFTTTQKTRTITVTIAVSLQRPSRSDQNSVTYLPTTAKREDITQGSDWGRGQEVYIQFAVRDTGRGLTEQEKKVLFQKFSQASAKTHVQYGGSGLGLFISRELAELQGGEIGVASEAGKGSTFAFYIKARRSTAPMESSEQGTTSPVGHHSVVMSNVRISSASKLKAVDSPEFPSIQKQVETVEGSQSETLNVMVCEDNEVNQRVLQKQLTRRGCVVHVANNGVEALDLLRKSALWKSREGKGIDVSIILMDLEMPVMDGLTCVREICKLKREGYLHPVPVIAVTANARAEQVKTALEAGMVREHPAFSVGGC